MKNFSLLIIYLICLFLMPTAEASTISRHLYNKTNLEFQAQAFMLSGNCTSGSPGSIVIGGTSPGQKAIIPPATATQGGDTPISIDYELGSDNNLCGEITLFDSSGIALFQWVANGTYSGMNYTVELSGGEFDKNILNPISKSFEGVRIIPNDVTGGDLTICYSEYGSSC